MTTMGDANTTLRAVADPITRDRDLQAVSARPGVSRETLAQQAAARPELSPASPGTDGGAADGAAFRYKPTQCALFPLEPDEGGWYVRQWGSTGEEWDLFCLNPAASTRPAAESLAGELALAAAVGREGAVAEHPAG